MKFKFKPCELLSMLCSIAKATFDKYTEVSIVSQIEQSIERLTEVVLKIRKIN